MITLITGGARSGKSAYAESRAGEHENVLYIATARADGDEEMIRRIEAHKKRRPASWRTVERDYDLAETIHEEDAALLDCVTVMLSNYLWNYSVEGEEVDEEKIEGLLMEELSDLIAAARRKDCDLFIVTNEVGSGIVPMHPVSRAFRDMQGRINQRLAQAADEVYACISGIPVKIK